MQPMHEPSPATDRSRRRPPRRRSDDPVPIPEARGRARRKRTVKLQDVLKSYQRAVVEVLEERIAAASQAAAEAARQAVEEALAERPRGPEESDVARGVLAYADERFQAMGLRLEQIEEALRRLAGDPTKGPPAALPADERVVRRLDEIAGAVTRLAADHQELIEDLGRRTGQGVVAVANTIREDLQTLGQDLSSLQQRVAGLGEGLDVVDTAVRSMHRTLAWEGMRAPRSPRGPIEPGSP